MFHPNFECIEYLYEQLGECGLYNFYFTNNSQDKITLSNDQKQAIIEIVQHFTLQEHTIEQAIAILENIQKITLAEEEEVTRLRSYLVTPKPKTTEEIPRIEFKFTKPETLYLEKITEMGLLKAALDKGGHTNKYGESKCYQYDLARCYFHYFQLKAITQD